MPGVFWTPEEDQQLRELLLTHTAQEIAAAMDNRSRKAIKRRCVRLKLSARWRICRGGLRAKIWHPEDDMKLISLTHLTQKKVADIMGVRLISIQRRAQALNIKWRQGRSSPASLAKLMGIGRGRVYRHCKKTGIGGGRGRKRGGWWSLTDGEVQQILEHFREGRLYLRRCVLPI